MNGTAGALSPPPAFLTVKGLEKPVPGLADRVARTLKTAMKDTSLLLLLLLPLYLARRLRTEQEGGQVEARFPKGHADVLPVHSSMNKTVVSETIDGLGN